MGIIAPILGLVIFIAFLVLLVFAIRWLVQRSAPRSGTAESTGALDIARRRLAAGEISIQQFEDIRSRLQE
jgi:uncharacterized membrane protein